MDADANRALQEHGAALAEAIVAAIPGWFARCAPGLDTTSAATAAVAELRPELLALLTADVDDQRVNPLALVRATVCHPTAVLRAAGVEPPPRRDGGFDAAHFPDDVYGLTPMTWRDIDESLHEPGIIWGALKARAHLARHGTGGDR